MLFIGEKVGLGGRKVDIALDPLEGTTLTAKAMPDALTVLALAEGGRLLHAPDVYMDKMAVGPGVPEGAIDLDASAADNVRAVAEALGKRIEDVTACVLDRPRHQEIIAGVRSVGARIKLIGDGDVAQLLNLPIERNRVDVLHEQARGHAPLRALVRVCLR